MLGNFVHRFIPGRRYVDGDIPNTDDIVLFVTKEAERTRNIGYQYGRVVELHVDGRANKVLVEYQNSNEVVKRKTTRNVKDLVLIHSSDELDFNTSEHMLAAAIQQKYLHFSYLNAHKINGKLFCSPLIFFRISYNGKLICNPLIFFQNEL